jgi:hypothetical protein
MARFKVAPPRGELPNYPAVVVKAILALFHDAPPEQVSLTSRQNSIALYASIWRCSLTGFGCDGTDRFLHKTCSYLPGTLWRLT